MCMRGGNPLFLDGQHASLNDQLLSQACCYAEISAARERLKDDEKKVLEIRVFKYISIWHSRLLSSSYQYTFSTDDERSRQKVYLCLCKPHGF